MEVTSKNIKSFILDPTNDLDELFEFVKEDFYNTVDGLLASLYKLLLRNCDQNKSRIEYLIVILDLIAEEADNSDYLKYLSGKIVDFDNNVVNNIKKKQRVVIADFFNKVNDIHNKVQNRLILDVKNGKLKLLEYLIFQDKNLLLIERALKEHSNILSSCNKDGDNIFSILLTRYIYLAENNQEEIDYLYQVILLFLESGCGRDIIQDKERYKRIIEKSKLKYKKHVIQVIELLIDDFQITIPELEERYRVRFDFPSIIDREIHEFQMDNAGRVNLLYQECVTIDGENDKCLDDALYLEKNEDGTYYLYIHIADIPSFIPFDSVMNQEAHKRIETLYLKDCHIPMYPVEISDSMCSLLPNNNRNVITYMYHLDSKCKLIYDVPVVIKGKIRVRHRLSYDEVDRRITNLQDNNLDKMLGGLYLFSLNQKENNPDKESYRALENYLEFETHHESLKTGHSPAANIVHESMILTNHGIGKYFMENKLPYTYRTLYVPTDEFINEQMKRIRSFDEKLIDDKTFRNALKESYLKAVYTTTPVLHKGLKLLPYSHSSSPLRRYNDAHNQYVIYDCVFNKKLDDLTLQAWEYRNQELVTFINNKKQENETFSRHYNYLAYKRLIKKK